MFARLLQVLRFEYLKFRILEILNFTLALYSLNCVPFILSVLWGLRGPFCGMALFSSHNKFSGVEILDLDDFQQQLDGIS